MTNQGKDCIILLDKLNMDHFTECHSTSTSDGRGKENVRFASPGEERKQPSRHAKRARKSGLLAELQKLQVLGFEYQLTIRNSVGQSDTDGVTLRRFSARIRDRSVSRGRSMTCTSLSPVPNCQRKAPQRRSSARSETSKSDQKRKNSSSKSATSSRGRGRKKKLDTAGYSALSDDEGGKLKVTRRKRSLSVKSCPGGLRSKAALGFPGRVSLDRKCKSKERIVEPFSSEEDDSFISSPWNELSSEKKTRKRSRSVKSCSGLSSTPYRSSTPRSCKSLIWFGEESDVDFDDSLLETFRSPSVEPRSKISQPRQRSPKPRRCKSRNSLVSQPEAPARSRKSLFEEQKAAKRSRKRSFSMKSCPDLQRHEEQTSSDPYDFISEPNEDIPQIEASKVDKTQTASHKKVRPTKKRKCSSNKENENASIQEKWNDFMSKFQSLLENGGDAFKQFEKVFSESLKHFSENSAGEEDSTCNPAAVHSRKDSTPPCPKPSTASNDVSEREEQSTAKRNHEVSSQFKHKKLKKVWEAKAKAKEVEQVIAEKTSESGQAEREKETDNEENSYDAEQSTVRADNVHLVENVNTSDESTTSTVLFTRSDGELLAGRWKRKVFQPTKKPRMLRKKVPFKCKLLSQAHLTRNLEKRRKKEPISAQKKNKETVEPPASNTGNSEEFTSIIKDVSIHVRQLNDDYRVIAELQAEATSRPNLAHSLKTVITSRYLKFQQKLKTFQFVIMKGYDRLVEMCEKASDVSVEISKVSGLSIEEVNKVISRCIHIEDICSEMVDGITGSSPRATAPEVNREPVSGKSVGPDVPSSNQNQSATDPQYVRYIYNTNIYSGCATQPPKDIPEVSRPEAIKTTVPSQPTQNFAPNVYVYPSVCKPKQSVPPNSSPTMPPNNYQDYARTRVSPVKTGFIMPEEIFAPSIPAEVLMRKPVDGLLALHQQQVMHLNKIINQDHGYTFCSRKSASKPRNPPSAMSLEGERRRSVRQKSDRRATRVCCEAPVGEKERSKTAPSLSQRKKPPEARIPPTARQPQQVQQFAQLLPNQPLRPSPPRPQKPFPCQWPVIQPQLWTIPRQPFLRPPVRPPLPRQASNRPPCQPPQPQPPQRQVPTVGESSGSKVAINSAQSATAVSQPSTSGRVPQPQSQPQPQSSTLTRTSYAPMLQIVASNLLRNAYPCVSRNSTIAGATAVHNAPPLSEPASRTSISPTIDPTIPHRLTMKDNRLQSGGALASSPQNADEVVSCKIEPVDEDCFCNFT